MRLYCATSNPGKLREFRLAAGGALEIELLPGFREIPSCIEDGRTFEENAKLKAQHYGQHATGLLFAEDSGLEVDALGGAPGVFSARFAGPNASDDENNQLLLERLHGITNRTARYICVIALAHHGCVAQLFRGSVEGRITELRGSHGFGYDPLFYYPPFGGTFGELEPERKFAVSHRGQALRALVDWLRRGTL
jgi:XTP/dITP diphosphohydrolase